jgi:hypothetical protein
MRAISIKPSQRTSSTGLRRLIPKIDPLWRYVVAFGRCRKSEGGASAGRVMPQLSK